MSRATVDTNVLVYALLEPATDKGRMSLDLLERLPARAVTTLQACGELLAVVRRKVPDRLPQVRDRLRRLIAPHELAPTDLRVLLSASELSQRHGLQFWDAVLWTAAAGAGATVLFSEDMHDGLTIRGMRILNPFNPDNHAEIDALLA